MVYAHGALYAYLSLYLAQLGYTKTAIGAFWVVSVVLEVAFFYTQGRWFARFGVFPLMTAAFVVAAVRFLLIAELATVWWVLAIAQAMHARRREKVITGHGKIAVFLQRHCPTIMSAIISRLSAKKLI
jgi:PPP family 3-phenylpropionic acid transporter